MNLYNLQQFKCTRCQHWFHPKNAQPFLLPCNHSVCTRCLNNCMTSRSIFCPLHQTNLALSKIKFNNKVQSALQRLIKDVTEAEQQRNASKPVTLIKNLQNLLRYKQEDRIALAQLLERIYQNEINRITHLRNRVRNQILGYENEFSNLKFAAENKVSSFDVMQEGSNLRGRLQNINKINFEDIANKIISNSSIALEPHFSIFNLLKSEKKVIKESVKYAHDRLESNFSLLSAKDQKQNTLCSFINKTTQSPQRLNHLKNRNNQIFCKELSSFKLDSSNHFLNDQHMKNSKLIEQFKLSNSLLEEYDENGQVTLRQNQHSKYSLKTKNNDKRQQKKSQFAQLINSLKIDDELVYSPEKSQDQMLLSETKHQINFLQQCPIERKSNKGDLQVRQKQILNIDREKNKYIRRMEGAKTEEAANNTLTTGNTLQLFNYDLKEVDLKAYLDKFDWSYLQAVKFVGTGMQDNQFNILLNYLLNTKVHTVLLPNNELQQISLDALVNFTSLNSNLKTLSLQRNNIHLLHGNSRAKIAMLRQRGLTLYI